MDDQVVEKVKNAVIDASSNPEKSRVNIFNDLLQNEKNENAKSVLKLMIDNFMVAREKKSPLCDDTGITHVILEIGDNRSIDAELMDSIQKGISEGLKTLPGRPMAVLGNDSERISQIVGLSDKPEDVTSTPFLMTKSSDGKTKLHILMHGGGPEIRAKTYRVFHKHDTNEVIDEIVKWSIDGVKDLGCTPCTLAIGIGRSHFEASALMLLAEIEGDYSSQSEMERIITERVNESGIGPLGLGGENTVIATFIKIGPQRASGVRIVSLRPCCCMEPRLASVYL